MVDLPPFCSFLLLAGAVCVGVGVARGAVPELFCPVSAVLWVRGIARNSGRAKMGLGVARVRRKARHGPPVGRGRGGRNQVR